MKRQILLGWYPSAGLPALIELGYGEDRQARWEGARPGDMGRYITPSGRELLRALGTGDLE